MFSFLIPYFFTLSTEHMATLLESRVEHPRCRLLSRKVAETNFAQRNVYPDGIVTNRQRGQRKRWESKHMCDQKGM